MTTTSVAVRCWLLMHQALQRGSRRCVDEQGQTSAEYALVLLGAGAIALLVLAWATGTDRLTRLLDAVFGQLLSHVRS